MRRLAFVTPLPPAATGIADYAVEVLELLVGRYQLDVFHDQQQVETERLPAGVGVFPAAELTERPAYDLVVYQLGNSLEHAFVYDLLPRRPGLLVLHELVLHHSRARMFVDSPAARAYAADPSNAARRAAALDALEPYRRELAYCYPGQGRRLAEVQLGSVGRLLPYCYPLFRLPVEAARLVAVHNETSARGVRDEVPDVEVVRLPMPVAPVAVAPPEVQELRARLGFASDDLVVGCFGRLTPEKRIDSVARAVARAARAVPELRLLLVGPVPKGSHLERRLEQLGVAGRTRVTGRVPFAELPVHMQAADCVAHLRYPTARETSAALLRLLAQGRPTIVSDLEQQADLPDDAVVRVDPTDEEGEVTRALLRLAARPALRQRLGHAAAAFVAREHAPQRCRDAYVRAIERAMTLPPPAPRPDWPAHWRQERQPAR